MKIMQEMLLLSRDNEDEFEVGCNKNEDNRVNGEEIANIESNISTKTSKNNNRNNNRHRKIQKRNKKEKRNIKDDPYHDRKVKEEGLKEIGKEDHKTC